MGVDEVMNEFDMPFDPRIRTRAIAACGLDYEIGQDGRLPWGDKHRGDTDFFREETMGHVVIMGRKTWNTFPENRVSDRDFIVLSETMDTDQDDIHVARGWTWAVREAIRCADTRQSDIYIAGGESVYQRALEDIDLIDEVILTVFSDTYRADRYFPEDALDDFKINEYRPLVDTSYPDDSYRASMYKPGVSLNRTDVWTDRARRLRGS